MSFGASGYHEAIKMNDGFIVVGAHEDDDNGTFSGAAYIYDLNDENCDEKSSSPNVSWKKNHFRFI